MSDIHQGAMSSDSLIQIEAIICWKIVNTADTLLAHSKALPLVVVIHAQVHNY